MTPDALIFDCDGTLADSMPAHLVAWQTTLRRHGLALTRERFYATAGMSSAAIIEVLCREQGVRVDIDVVRLEKDEAYLQHVGAVRPIDVVVEVARSHRGRLPMAVATGNVRRIAEATLTAIELRPWFQALVAADDVERPKPAPDTFLEAARRLGVEPRACRVYEDGDPGIEAARAAGMEVVDIRPWLGPPVMDPAGRTR